ncbi:MAG: FIST signal transduction protein [Geminicoccaceae bacterium]
MKPFRAASGTGPDWLAACDACLEELDGLSPKANLGFVYASDPLAHAMDLISERLKDVTGIDHWVGTGGSGVCTTGRGVFDEGTIVVLAASLPAHGFRVFDGLRHGAGDGGSLSPDLRNHHFAIVHGDPRQTKTASMIERLGKDTDAFLVGGLTSANGNGAMQIAGSPTEGGLSGVLITDEVSIITGLSQGCTPIGPTREITAIDGPWIVTIDNQPALDVLKQDIGPILSRSLERISGFIFAARPEEGTDHPDLLVRELGDIDPIKQLLMVGDDLRRGDPLCFVKRDPEGARANLRRMTADLRRRAGDRSIHGALYHSCVARGRQMFGTGSDELFMIEEELGHIPLAGLFTNGEIFRDRLYGYSGVLTLFLGD